MRKATFLDYGQFKTYLEGQGLNTEQAKVVYVSAFELARITMIMGFLMGLFLGMWIL